MKSWFKGQLNVYATIYFDRNISENKDGWKNEGSYWSCVTNGEFHYNWVFETTKVFILFKEYKKAPWTTKFISLWSFISGSLKMVCFQKP